MIYMPSQLIEALDGAVAPLFATMFVLSLVYLYRVWRDNGYSLTGVRVEAKGAWASAMLFLGVGMKNDTLWFWRHVTRTHGDFLWLQKIAPCLAVVSTAIILWACICWMKNVMPIRCSPWAWVWLTLGSVGFGIYMAM